MFAQYLPNIFSIFAQYLSNICTMFAQYLHTIFAIFAQYSHNISTIFSNICTIFSQYFQNVCTIFVVKKILKLVSYSTSLLEEKDLHLRNLLHKFVLVLPSVPLLLVLVCVHISILYANCNVHNVICLEKYANCNIHNNAICIMQYK